jgi:hypothetical protein
VIILGDKLHHLCLQSRRYYYLVEKWEKAIRER